MSNTRTGRVARLCGIASTIAVGCALAVPAAGAERAEQTAYGPAATDANYAGSLWGGYVAEGQGFTSVTGSWVQPQVQCTSTNDLYAPWVGIDGYGSRTVEQTGVETNCSSGSPVNRPWFEMYPSPPQYWNDTVDAGDHMTGTVTYQGGSYTITLTDDTTGWTEHVNKRMSARNVSAEAVIESPTHSYPRFAKLTFSGIQVNGESFDTYDPQPLTSGGYRPGPLSGGSYSMTPGYGSHSNRQAITPDVIRY